MKSQLRFATIALPALLAVLAPAASAGCGDVSQMQAPLVFPASQGTSQTTANAQALVQRAAVAAAAMNSGAATFNTASIVGLWSIQLISQGNANNNPSIPDGALLDFGYTEWHSDGTEIFNSGGRAPATENFCLGVWVRSGFFTYELNHIALGYDATSGQLNSKSIIHESITLDPGGNIITGTVTITVFNPTTNVQVDQLTGTITGTRFTVDQTTP